MWIARFVALLAIAPPSEWKCTSAPAFAKVETARSGRFTAATWKLDPAPALLLRGEPQLRLTDIRGSATASSK
eukprot:4173632-Alexandrium_andersonii.AAC.1